jgi:hypothetical protein
MNYLLGFLLVGVAGWLSKDLRTLLLVIVAYTAGFIHFSQLFR